MWVRYSVPLSQRPSIQACEPCQNSVLGMWANPHGAYCTAYSGCGKRARNTTSSTPSVTSELSTMSPMLTRKVRIRDRRLPVADETGCSVPVASLLVASLRAATTCHSLEQTGACLQHPAPAHPRPDAEGAQAAVPPTWALRSLPSR